MKLNTRKFKKNFKSMKMIKLLKKQYKRTFIFNKKKFLIQN